MRVRKPGLAIEKPTVGAVKKRLIDHPVEKEGRTLLVDKGEVIGKVVTTKQGTKPIYVNIDHVVSLDNRKNCKTLHKSRIPRTSTASPQFSNHKETSLTAKAK